MAIISGIHLLSREKVRKLVIEKWGIAFTEVVRSMDGGDYCTACLVCFQFQWDCIIFNRHIISMKSQGFFQTPQDIMEECVIMGMKVGPRIMDTSQSNPYTARHHLPYPE